MACCVTCHSRVRLVFTDRGRLLPVNLTSGLVRTRLAVRGTKVRHLWGETPQLEPGERYAVAHWDRSPACKPPRKRAQQVA